MATRSEHSHYASRERSRAARSTPAGQRDEQRRRAEACRREMDERHARYRALAAEHGGQGVEDVIAAEVAKHDATCTACK